MRYKLENEKLSIEVDTLGAELCSLYDKANEKEYLWHGQSIWKRHSPVLFPNIGGFYENQYIYKEEVYQMPPHGFARDSEFQLFTKRNNELIFLLESNPATRAMYPFDFDLYIFYIIEGKSVKVKWQVINKTDTSMFFNIGAHPAFKLTEGSTISDYTISFDKKIEIRTLKSESRLVSDVTYPLPQYNGQVKKIKMNKDLFMFDTLILNQGIERISLKNIQQDFNLSIEFLNFPYVALWTVNETLPDAPFLCIEPWHGINDIIGQGVKPINEKKDIITLAPQQRWQAGYTISIDS